MTAQWIGPAMSTRIRVLGRALNDLEAVDMNRTRLRRIAFIALLSGAGGFCVHASATCTSSLSGSTATVTCTSPADNLQIGQYLSGLGIYYWFHQPIGDGSYYDWDSNVPGWQFLEATAASTIDVHLAGGALTVGISQIEGTPARSADAMVGIVNWHGSGSVALDASFATAASTYTIDDGTSPFATTVNALTLFNQNTAQMTIITGTAADTVNVLSVYPLDSIETFNHAGGGIDSVHVGKVGNVQGVKGVLDVYGYSSLMIDDSSDASPRTATLASNSIAGLAPGVISWAGSGVIDVPVAIVMGNNADTVTVQSTDRPVTIDGTSGSDTVTLGNGGSVQGILGAVDVSNYASRTALTIDDSADTIARTATYTKTGVSGIAPAAITWPENDVSAVSLRMGTGQDTVRVLSVHSGSGNPLTIHGTNAVDSVYFGDASGSTQQILTPVMVDNTASYTSIYVDDSADTTARSVTYSKTGITGVAPGAIGWVSNDVGSVRLYLGSGGDVVHVASSNRNVAGRSFVNVIDLGDGNNQCTITGEGLGAASVNSFYGETGDDQFVISAVPTSVNSVNIYGGAQAVWDELVYTGGPATGAFPGNGTLTPTDTDALAINYNSIEHFSVNDVIFRDGFQ